MISMLNSLDSLQPFAQLCVIAFICVGLPVLGFVLVSLFVRE